MLSLLKNLFAGKELAELHRWQLQWEEYRRWLAEFPAIAMVLDNFKSHANGESLDACHPPAPTGPWTIENLRFHLRKQNETLNKRDAKFDDQWHAEFNKKHEQLVAAQARNKLLEVRLQDAVEMLLGKTRELNETREVCELAYEHLLTFTASDRVILDKLSAAKRGTRPPQYPAP